MMKHSKHYYEMNRNTSEKINPKMKLSKEDLLKHDPLFDKELKVDIDYSKDKTPNYYIGEVFGYEARNIIEDFDLSYNVGTCLSYILRAKRKHDTQVECIQKAINHLEFELDKLKR